MEAHPTVFRFNDGSEMEVLERPSSAEDRLVMEFRFEPDFAAPPPHVHPYTAESYEVTEGTLEVQVGKEWLTLNAGESATVPAGERHTFRNPGTRVVAKNVHDPHHDFETYIRRVAELAKNIENIEKPGPRAMAQMAMIWGEHDDLIRPSDAPMKLGMAVLRTVGRVTGQKPPPR